MLRDQSILVPLLTRMQINKVGKLSNHESDTVGLPRMTIFTTI